MRPLADLIAPPVAFFRSVTAASSRTWLLALAYLALALTVLATVAALVDALGGHLRAALQRFLFPDELQVFAELAVDVVFRSQSRALVANLTATLGLVVVSALLFFVKEQLSRSIEHDRERRHGPPSGPPRRDHPFWREALEEIGLVLVYAALAIGVFALGQTVDPTRRTLALILSHLVLFFTWSVDFLAPALFRRSIPYAGVFRLVAAHPLAAVVFGALAALPTTFALTLLDGAEVTNATRMAVTVALQGLSIIAATFAGSWLALDQLSARAEPARLAVPAPAGLRALGWLFITATLGLGAVHGTSMGRALVGKAQILRCQWAIVPGTLALELPEADPIGWATGKPVSVGLRLDVRITNDTPLPVSVENTRFEVADGEHVIATTSVDPFEVPRGASVVRPLHLVLSIRPDVFLKGASLNPADWSMAVWIRLDSGLDFPIPVRAP
jgi:hypothetical protein